MIEPNSVLTGRILSKVSHQVPSVMNPSVSRLEKRACWGKLMVFKAGVELELKLGSVKNAFDSEHLDTY